MRETVRVMAPAVGAKVYVRDEKRPYTVRAANGRFAVCTKRHFKTVLYTVLDVKRAERGPENLIFGMGAETDDQCRRMLARLAKGDSEVSYRNCVSWDIVRVVAPTPEERPDGQ